jgi:alcohol dehydrogenase (cytochrome c)
MIRYGWIILMLAGMLLIPAVSGRQSNDTYNSARREWPLVDGDSTNERYSTLTQINTKTVKQLGGVWTKTFEKGDSTRAAPVVRDGLMFVNAGRRVYALNAKTGEARWTWHSDSQQTSALSGEESGGSNLTSSTAPGLPSAPGVAVAEGRVYVGLTDGRVVALDQNTGKLLWSQRIGANPPQKGESVSGAPTYSQGMVFAGLANGDFALRGRVVALDAKSGHELWHFFTIPGPGEPGHETWPRDNDIFKIGGGGVWRNGAVDPDLGLVYFVTGNAIPPFGGEVRSGNNLFTVSVLALEMRTGKLRWHYQLVHHDIWEADLAMPPVLYDINIAGKKTNGIAIMRADGYLFLLDRQTGKPIFPTQEQPVPQDSRMKTSPTQPFPVNADEVLPNCREWRKEKIPAGFVVGCFFTPVFYDKLNVLRPFFGMRIVPMSFSQQTGYFYVTGIEFLGWRRRTDDPFMLLNLGDTAPGLTSHGVIAAIDSRTNKIVWKHENLAGRSGGSLTTAGGLMFESEADGYLKAYDAKTGDVLWQFQIGMLGGGLSSGGRGPATSYEVDGDQYIAVPAGSSVWAFKLGGSLPSLLSPKQSLKDELFTGPIVDTDEIETMSLDRDENQPVGGNRYYIDEYKFSPVRARVRVGTRVTWINNGRLVHTIKALDGSWSTASLNPAEAGYVTFNKPGAYTYICKDHPWVYAQLIVVDSASQHGLYTENQASRGKVAYDKSCTSCHMDNLSGNGEAPGLAGQTFMGHWQGQSILDLLERIRATMPQNKPGSLSAETYVDIIAFLLQSNDFPSGDKELKPISETLKGTKLSK